MSCSKTAEPIEMLFVGLTPVDPRINRLDEGQDRTNLFAVARRDRSAKQPFGQLLLARLHMV